MDAAGARYLSARIAAGADIGGRVEVVWVQNGNVAVKPGDRGTVRAFDDGVARIEFDGGTELAIDPLTVRLRPVSG